MAEIFSEPLTEYCREELAKFTTFLTSKSAEIDQFSVGIGQFSNEKGRFGCSIVTLRQ